MNSLLTCVSLCALVAVAVLLSPQTEPAPAADAGPKRMLSHDVFFSLKDNSPEAVKKLVADCGKYLSGHSGAVWFAAGPLAEEMNREVNDRDFDVALHVVFESKADHDVYAKAERHLKFIAENQANWKKVRVFDSYIYVK